MAFKWTAPRTWVAGEKPTAATLNTHVRDQLEALNGYVVKAADESVTSSTTHQDDNHLTYTIPQAGTYIADWHIGVTSAADAAGDISVRFTFPAGTLHVHHYGLTTSLPSATEADLRAPFGAEASSPSTARTFGASTNSTSLLIRTVLQATASGTLTLQWAQATSNANATTVEAGSNMTIQQKA